MDRYEFVERYLVSVVKIFRYNKQVFSLKIKSEVFFSPLRCIVLEMEYLNETLNNCRRDKSI